MEHAKALNNRRSILYRQKKQQQLQQQTLDKREKEEMDLASVDYVEKVINAYMGEHNSCCAKPLKIERIQNTAQGLYYSKLKERELEIVANGVIGRTKLPEKAVNQRKNQKKNQRRTKRRTKEELKEV